MCTLTRIDGQEEEGRRPHNQQDSLNLHLFAGRSGHGLAVRAGQPNWSKQ